MIMESYLPYIVYYTQDSTEMNARGMEAKEKVICFLCACVKN